MDQEMKLMLGGILGILVLASLLGAILGKKAQTDASKATVANLVARVNSWWVMAGVFAVTLLLGSTATTVLFAGLSFLAMREFVTLNRTERADHAVLFWSFFVILPLHYFLVGIQWYGMFTIFIPVYAFAFLPFRRVLTGETKDFLVSTAKIQWALLVCVYAVSHIPMLLALPIPGYEGQNGKLLLFFVLTVQLSDVLQYAWGKTMGKRKVAPRISPSKTWEGTVGGIFTTSAICASLYWVTPFSPWQAATMAFICCVAGFFGGLVMSAIKRDLGAKDWGQSIAGHGGFMDRLDSLCFAAPLFFHLCGFYFGAGMDPRAPEWIGHLLGRH